MSNEEVLSKDPVDRAQRLLDEGSFEFLLPRTDCGMIAATGSVKGNKVVLFASDATIKSGALGIEGSRVILAAYKEAMASQLPIIGIWHSGGARLSDGVLSLDAFGEVFQAMILASGRIPQLSLVLGPTAGGGAYGPALTDVVVLAPEGRIFVTGPDVVKSVTGEDVELGYRIQQAGFRMVADRQAHSWHLGYSTYEKFADELKRHNDPALAQYIAEQRTTRERSTHRFKVSTYEVVVDARSCTLKQFLDHKAELLSLSGTQADFTILGNWSDLKKRYSPTQDNFTDLRELYAWLKGDNQFKFVDLAADAHLSIEEILDLYANNSTPIRIFVEGDFKLSLKDLVAHLRITEMGLLGLVNEQDKRAFAVLNSSLARARRSKGDVYANISNQFGLHWMIYNENYEKTYKKLSADSGIKHTITARGMRYLKREIRKINSPKQLLVFINKSLKIVKKRLLSNGR